jgi:hypothetical protein
VLLQTTSDHAALVRRVLGKGKAYLLGFCVQDSYFQTHKAHDERSREQLRTLIRTVTEDAGVRAHVSSSAADVALRANSRAAFLFVVNHGAKSSRTTVRLSDTGFTVARIVDLSNQPPVPFERSKSGIGLVVGVEPQQPKVLRIVYGNLPASEVAES